MRSPEAPSGLARGLPRRHARWFRFCLGGILAFLALHSVYLVSFALPGPLSSLWGTVLFLEFFLFFHLGTTVLLPVLLGAVLLVLIAAPFRPRWFFRDQQAADGSLRTGARAWLSSLVWTGLLAAHLVFDIDPRLAAASLSFGAPVLLGRQSDLRARGIVLAALLIGWYALARDSADVLGAAVLAALLAPILLIGARRLVARDILALALGATALAQLVAAIAPAFADFHGGKKLGNGMAYSFCEATRQGKLFAVVPTCSPNALYVCLRKSVVEVYDLDDLTWIATYRPLSDRFFGRLEQLACYDDVVEIGLDATMVDGEHFRHSLLEFRIDDPSDVTLHVLREAAGDGIAWDRKHDVSYYVSQDRYVLRRDRRTGAIDATPGAILAEIGSPKIIDVGIHEGRNSLLVAGIIGKVFEFDLDTLELEATYPYGNAWEFAVDEELERLYLAGNFGLEVLDLRRGRVVHRARLALMGRRPVLDTRRDLLYVPSTGGGRLHVFDRRDLTPLGTIPIGAGMRYAYLSKDGRRLFTSSLFAHLWWDAEDLARRFDPRQSRR